MSAQPNPDGVSRVTGIILAGGRSRRLGIDKTTMPWPPGSSGDRTLLQATGEKLEQVCDEVLVAGYRGDRPLPYRVVPDLYEEGGSLGGIYSGLVAAEHEYALAVATDMPFLNLRLVEHMLAQPRDYEVLVPVCGEIQTLHALYSKRCLAPMKRRLDAGRLKITGFFDDVRVRYVDEATVTQLDPETLSFFNVNTPEDLERARRVLAAEALGR